MAPAMRLYSRHRPRFSIFTKRDRYFTSANSNATYYRLLTLVAPIPFALGNGSGEIQRVSASFDSPRLHKARPFLTFVPWLRHGQLGGPATPVCCSFCSGNRC